MNATTTTMAAGSAAFGAQSLVPVIHWLGEHYQVQPTFTPELEYSLALIVIGAGGAVIGTGVVIARALIARWMKDHNLAIPTPETEKPNA